MPSSLIVLGSGGFWEKNLKFLVVDTKEEEDGKSRYQVNLSNIFNAKAFPYIIYKENKFSICMK